MEGQGMSLFQGAGSIHINNSAQDRLQEQEELEDQKRRNAELKDELENAFDDLQDDDDASSVDNSANFTMEVLKTNGTNGPGHVQKLALPTYVESLNHLKEVHHAESLQPYCDTPKNHHVHVMTQDDPIKLNFSPCGAGDGQNHYYHQDFRDPLNGVNNYATGQEYSNPERLKLMYEMRVKECHQLASQLEEVRSQSESETNGLRARLAAAAADRDRAEHSLQQAHQLLATSKHKLVELEQQVSTERLRLVDCEQDKEQLRMELRAANINLQDAQQRLQAIQVARTHDTDALFREQLDRHREEMDRYHNDLQKVKNRLEEKENEIKVLEKRCMERDREKEDILVEKGATINRLAGELEQAQSRLVSGEAARLKERVSQLTNERNTLKEQVKELGSKLELTAHELVLCRQKLDASQKELENWRSNLHQILAESLHENPSYVGESSSPGKLSTLKEILGRYKQQIQRLTNLQEELSKRDKKLEHHRKQESELRSKIEEQKGVEMQLNSRLAVLQNKLELLDSNSDSELLESYKQHNKRLQNDLEECRAEFKNLEIKYTELELELDKLKSERGGHAARAHEANADLLRELDRHSARLKDTLKENGELKTLYLQACSSRDAALREIKEFESKIQKEKDTNKAQEKEYNERLEKERQQTENVTSNLTIAKEELERANKRISELQKEFSDKQKEFTNKLNKYLSDEKSSIRKELESCLQCDKHLNTISNLEEKLNRFSLKMATQESNEELMKELKSKADFFQKYIMERFQKLQEQRNVGTNTEQPPPSDQQPPTATTDEPRSEDRITDDEITAKTNLMIKEKEIREQIAQKFTLEIKTLEMNCSKRLKEMENEHITTVSKLKQLLEKKAQEVETLKNFILTERAKVTEILNAKENEICDLIKEHNSLQEEYQQLKDKAGALKNRYVEKIRAVEDKYKNEREVYKRNIVEWEKEKQLMTNKLTELDSEYQLLKSKYKNAKKTAYMYKEYVEKKDIHVNGELSRIQQEYMDIFMKMEGRIQQLVTCRLQQANSPHRDDNQPPDYSEMLHRLQNEISALAQSKYDDKPTLR